MMWSSLLPVAGFATLDRALPLWNIVESKNAPSGDKNHDIFHPDYIRHMLNDIDLGKHYLTNIINHADRIH